MNKSKIIVSAGVLDAIADSGVLSELEKLSFLKYVAYMSHAEQAELIGMI